MNNSKLIETPPLVSCCATTSSAQSSTRYTSTMTNLGTQAEEWQSQFLKTKLCPYHLSGRCINGIQCRFAHNTDELRPLPDLHRTKLCESYVKKELCCELDCPFAHDPSELRTSSHSFYKVTLCNFYKKGRCWNGVHCRFAHGTTELQMSQRIQEQALERFPELDNTYKATDCGSPSCLSSNLTTASPSAPRIISLSSPTGLLTTSSPPSSVMPGVSSQQQSTTCIQKKKKNTIVNMNCFRSKIKSQKTPLIPSSSSPLIFSELLSPKIQTSQFPLIYANETESLSSFPKLNYIKTNHVQSKGVVDSSVKLPSQEQLDAELTHHPLCNSPTDVDYLKTTFLQIADMSTKKQNKLINSHDTIVSKEQNDNHVKQHHLSFSSPCINPTNDSLWFTNFFKKFQSKEGTSNAKLLKKKKKKKAIEKLYHQKEEKSPGLSSSSLSSHTSSLLQLKTQQKDYYAESLYLPLRNNNTLHEQQKRDKTDGLKEALTFPMSREQLLFNDDARINKHNNTVSSQLRSITHRQSFDLRLELPETPRAESSMNLLPSLSNIMNPSTSIMLRKSLTSPKNSSLNNKIISKKKSISSEQLPQELNLASSIFPLNLKQFISFVDADDSPSCSQNECIQSIQQKDISDKLVSSQDEKNDLTTTDSSSRTPPPHELFSYLSQHDTPVKKAILDDSCRRRTDLQTSPLFVATPPKTSSPSLQSSNALLHKNTCFS